MPKLLHEVRIRPNQRWLLWTSTNHLMLQRPDSTYYCPCVPEINQYPDDFNLGWEPEDRSAVYCRDCLNNA